MNDKQAIISTNEAFYKAFSDSDFDAMVGVWAYDENIACAHPGWDVLIGYHDVMESWRAIMDVGTLTEIICCDIQTFLFGDSAFVTCHEIVNGSHLVATNIFARRQGEWRMVHHQAGPYPGTEDDFEDKVLGSLH